MGKITTQIKHDAILKALEENRYIKAVFNVAVDPPELSVHVRDRVDVDEYLRECLNISIDGGLDALREEAKKQGCPNPWGSSSDAIFKWIKATFSE